MIRRGQGQGKCHPAKSFEGLALWAVLDVECAEARPVDVFPEVLCEVEHTAPHQVARVPRSLLYPKHLDGIYTGQTLYRLTYYTF